MKKMRRAAAARKRPRPTGPDGSTRERVLRAAFAVFRARGFSGASTLEIATRAKVSKRDLYALFDSKEVMLTACITARAGRMRQPLDPAAPLPRTQADVAATLVALGSSILRGISDPDVLAVYRLAIAESDRAPEVARALDSGGREANHRALGAWIAQVQAQGLIGAGEPVAITERFIALLWGGGLLVGLLLRVRDVPSAAEIEARARAATEALLALHPPSRVEN